MSFAEYDPYEEVFEHVDQGTLNTTILPDYGGPTIRHSTYKTGMIVVLAILFILAFVAIVLAIQYSSNSFVVTLNPNVDRKAPNLAKRKPGFINDQFTINSHPGAISSQMVESYQNGYRRTDDGSELKNKDECETVGGNWDKGCTCPKFHWGKRCERESYPTDYLMADLTNTSNLSVKEVYRTDGLFGEGVKCTDLCEQDSDCKAIHWDKYTKTCSLLSNAPDINDLTFNPEVDGNVFIRQDRGVGRPLVANKVVLYNGKLMNRFWLDPINFKEDYQIMTLDPNKVSRLNFYPSGCLNDGLLPIVYSTKNFDLREARSAIQSMKDGVNMTDFYVHLPGKNSFNPPLSMTIDPYYVMPVLSVQTIPLDSQAAKSGSFKLISGSRSITKSVKSHNYSLESESSIDSSMSYDRSSALKMVSSNWST